MRCPRWTRYACRVDPNILGEGLGGPDQHVRPALDEPLIQHLPDAPPRARRVRDLHGSRAVGHGIRGIGYVLIVRVARDAGRVEAQTPAFAQVQVAGDRVARRPRVVAPPAVRAALEHERLGERQRPAVLEVVREERRLDLAAEPHTRGVAEPDRRAGYTGGASVAPGSRPAPWIGRSDRRRPPASRVVRAGGARRPRIGPCCCGCRSRSDFPARGPRGVTRAPRSGSG